MYILNKLPKKLYDLNRTKYHVLQIYSCGHDPCSIYYKIPDFDQITMSTWASDKYTVVQLEFNGKHYHGLASRSKADKHDINVGIAIAYNRAFKQMIGVQQ